MAVGAPPAHRLVLTAAEWSLLVDRSAIEPPAGFGFEQVDEPARRDAASTLTARGVVVVDSDDPLDCRPVASIAANLATLAAPTVTVRVEVAVDGRGLRAMYAIAGPLGASLFALAGGGVELSMFAAEALGRELIRAVPGTDELVTAEARVRAALGGGPAMPLSGRLPLAALAEYDPARRVGGHDAARRVGGHDAARRVGGHDAGLLVANLGLTAREAVLAAQVAQHGSGTLRCLVSGAGGDGVLVAEVVWLATDAGWVGLRPDPDGSDRQMVTLHPVAREDIGVWLAPYLAVIVGGGR